MNEGGYQFAPVSWRVASAIIDGLIGIIILFLASLAVLILVVPLMDGLFGLESFSGPGGLCRTLGGGLETCGFGYRSEPARHAGLAIFEIGLLATLSFLVYLQWAGNAMGTTFGKGRLGLRVVDSETGRSLGMRRGLLRLIGYAVSLYVTPVILISAAMGVWNRRKQTLHDRLAGSIVVRYHPVVSHEQSSVTPLAKATMFSSIYAIGSFALTLFAAVTESGLFWRVAVLLGETTRRSDGVEVRYEMFQTFFATLGITLVPALGVLACGVLVMILRSFGWELRFRED